MNIRQATERALEKRFGTAPAAPGYLKTPVSKESGQKSRLRALSEAYKGDRKAIAQAIGISPGTLTRWLGGKQGIGKANQGRLDTAYRRTVDDRHQRSLSRWKAGVAGKAVTARLADAKVRVTAEIRWSRSDKKQYNAHPHRTTTLDNIDLRPVVESWLAGHDPGAMLEAQVTDQYQADGGVGFEGDNCTVEIP